MKTATKPSTAKLSVISKNIQWVRMDIEAYAKTFDNFNVETKARTIIAVTPENIDRAITKVWVHNNA